MTSRDSASPLSSGRTSVLLQTFVSYHLLLRHRTDSRTTRGLFIDAFHIVEQNGNLSDLTSGILRKAR